MKHKKTLAILLVFVLSLSFAILSLAASTQNGELPVCLVLVEHGYETENHYYSAAFFYIGEYVTETGDLQAGRACFEGEQYDFVGFHPLSADALMQIKAVLKTDPAVKQVIYELPSSGGTDALPGDVDGDFTVTAADARLALRAAVALETLTPEQTAVADADFDGSITAADARLILRVAVGLETLNLS